MSMRLVISHSFHIIWTCGIIVNAVVNIVTNQDNTSYYECSNLEETSGALYPSDERINPAGYVIIGSLSEELTKARLHLADAFAFAKVTNRTVVLPSVGRSLIGSRLKYALPLCAYFSTESIGEFIPWITEEYFISKVLPELQDGNYVTNLFWHPSSTSCRVDGSPPIPQLETIDTCEKYYTMTDFPSNASNVCVECGDALSAESQSLEETKGSKVVSVMKVTWNCDCFNSEVEPRVEELIAENLKGRKYLAIHWRMAFQALHPEHFSQVPRCLAGLLKTAREKLSQGNYSAVFFASDMGKGKRLMSLTWKFNSAMKNKKVLEKAVNAIHEELSPVTMEAMEPQFLTMDLGVLGIMDKLLCINSYEFIYAPGECIGSFAGKSGSSFVREIESLRFERGLPAHLSSPWDLSA